MCYHFEASWHQLNSWEAACRMEKLAAHFKKDSMPAFVTPNVLDRLSSLLRDNPHATQITYESSMDNAVALVQNLSNTMVKLGDVRQKNDVGYVAIGALDDDHVTQELSRERKYK